MGKKRIALAVTVMVTAAYSLVAVPQATAAGQERERRNNSILIGNDSQFTGVNGVRSGSGTASDPYVISNWDVSQIKIHDTSKHFVITNNTIDFLTLNWTGNRVTVTNNDISDLRVNENVRRTGGPTTGQITNNTFDVVGQLRHFDGVFAHNKVGSPGGMEFPFFTNRAVNFDGFNGAHFFDNVLYGSLEVRLHGHHHSSDFGESSHHHGAAAQHDHSTHEDHSMDDMVDHTKRFHQVWVHDNTIYSSAPYALIYTDSAHFANDRTATSETNEELNKPHTHYTKVHLTGNKLVGSGLYVDIFNANDRNHMETNRGVMHIANNDITVMSSDDRFPYERRDGINVWNGTDMNLRIAGNAIRYDRSKDLAVVGDRLNRDSGISLQTLDLASVSIVGNSVADMFYGVRASDMTASVVWRIFDLKTSGVEEPVSYDESVANEPEMDQ